jgi:hypothetical protein
MAAYWIGQHAITDTAAFADYLRQVIPMIERHGGRYLTRAGAHLVPLARVPATHCVAPERRDRLADRGRGALGVGHARLSASSLSAAAANRRMFSTRSSLPVSSVIARSLAPTRAMHVCPAGSP